jgi:hypothetical protein
MAAIRAQTVLIMRLAGQSIARREHSRERIARVRRCPAFGFGCDEKVTCLSNVESRLNMCVGRASKSGNLPSA